MSYDTLDPTGPAARRLVEKGVRLWTEARFGEFRTQKARTAVQEQLQGWAEATAIALTGGTRYAPLHLLQDAVEGVDSRFHDYGVAVDSFIAQLVEERAEAERITEALAKRPTLRPVIT